MEERDSDYFFGRRTETVEALKALVARDRLPVLIGNSGVGKSSIAKAGVLATLRDDGEPTRRRALRSEFSDEEWRLIGELADNPNRLLVTTRLETGETYAEVAHEAIFRRWDKLKDWIAKEREFLAWRSGLEATRRAWEATATDKPPRRPRNDELLMGAALTQAKSRLARRPKDISQADRAFIVRSRKAVRRRRLVYNFFLGALCAVLLAWWNEAWVKYGFITLIVKIYLLATVTARKRAPSNRVTRSKNVGAAQK
jgi:hypothetical protein